MTRTQFRKRSKQLKKSVAELIDAKIEHVLDSGCLDLKAYEDNFLLPKAFMSAVGTEIEYQFRPLTKEMRKVSDTITVVL